MAKSNDAGIRVRVTSVPEKGFRRAGFGFTREAKEVAVDDKQLLALKAEPLLVVEEIK